MSMGKSPMTTGIDLFDIKQMSVKNFDIGHPIPAL